MSKPNCTCMVCNKPVYRNPNNMPTCVTCSAVCRAKIHNTLTRVTVTCDICGVVFTKKPSRSTSAKHFCSVKCQKESRAVGYSAHDAAWLSSVGYYDYQIAKLFGCSRVWVTKALNGLGYINRRGKADDVELRKRISKTNTGKRSGVNSSRYKGKSEYTVLARGIFSAISRQVKEDREYTCEFCYKSYGTLHVHHKKPFSLIIDEFLKLNPKIPLEDFSARLVEYPEFMDTTNLILLCQKCHYNIFH